MRTLTQPIPHDEPGNTHRHPTITIAQHWPSRNDVTFRMTKRRAVTIRMSADDIRRFAAELLASVAALHAIENARPPALNA